MAAAVITISLIATIGPPAPPRAAVAQPAEEPGTVDVAANWVPFRGTFSVGCTRANPDNPSCPVHHPTWAIDFGIPTDRKIRATGHGVVIGVFRGCSPAGGDGECNGGAGNIVIVEHGDYWSRYLHLSRVPNRIQRGRIVEPGDVIGRSGASGTFGGAHLHYDEFQLGPPTGRVAFGSMWACHNDVAVVYPEVLGYSSWDEVPRGTSVRNDGYDCVGHPGLPHPPAPEPPIYPEGATLGVGGSVAVAVADFDGDGDVDLAIGAPGARTGSDGRTGMVSVVDPVDRNEARSLVQGSTLRGFAEAGDRVGASVASGDFDCDGQADLAIGAPGEDLDATFVDMGAVNVIYGSGDQELLFSGFGLDSYYRRPSDWLGAALAVGDFNDDDCDDLAIASPGADRVGGLDMGLIWMLRGSQTGLERPLRVLQGVNAGGVLESNDQTGYSLATGDFNCDGLSDLAAGVPREVVDGVRAGAVMVTYGTTTGFQGGEALYQGHGFAGPAHNAGLVGLSLAAGDIDGDGCDDLATGAPGMPVGGLANAGAALLTYGGPDGLGESGRTVTLTSGSGLPGQPRGWDRAGAAVAIGDTNCDGFADLAVGIPKRDIGRHSNAGIVRIVDGSAIGLTEELSTLRQRQGLKGKVRAKSQVGSGIVVGDVNQDGCDDLVISAPGTTVSDRQRAGAIHIAYGAPDGAQATASLRIDQRGSVPGEPTKRGTFGGSSPLDLFKKALARN